MKLKGIDISAHQVPSKINYDKLAKEVDFVVLRAGVTGYGVNPPYTNNYNKDKYFDTHYAEFNKRGIPIGVYWYGGAITTGEADKELAVLLDAIKGKKIEYPVYYDVEENRNHGTLSKAKLTEITKYFCNAVETAGYFAGIYASLHWTNAKLDMTQLPYSLWLAHWGVPKPGKECGMWQYTSDGFLNGYNGRLDMNEANMDFKQVITDAGLNHLGGATKPPADKPADKPKDDRDPKYLGLSNATVVDQVINGIWYNDQDRVNSLTRYGYDAKLIQKMVNEKLYGKPITPKPAGINKGDTVEIIGYGNGQASGNGGRAGGIGWKRQVLDVNTANAYPYRVGNNTGTTGFYKASALKKL